MSERLITIIVPLKDSARRLSHFVLHSIHDDFHYLFLDGSLTDSNQRLMERVQKSNVKYHRYPADHTLSDFYKKMAHGTSLVETPFAVMVDSGDYVISEGLRAAQATLVEEPSLSSAGGDILAVRELGPWLSNPWPAPGCSALDQLDFAAAMHQISQSYSYLWYAVQKANLLHQSWSVIARTQLRQPFMEYLPTVCLLSHGRYSNTGVTHLVRVAHGPSNWTSWNESDVVETGQAHDSSGLDQFAALCSEEFGVEAAHVRSAFAPDVAAIAAQFNTTNRIAGNNIFRRLATRLPVPPESIYSRLNGLVKIYAYFTPLAHGRSPSQMIHYRLPWSRRDRRLAEIVAET